MKYVDVLHVVTWHCHGETLSSYFVNTVECSDEQGASRKAERRLRSYFKQNKREVVSITLGYVRPCGYFDELVGKVPGYSISGVNERV